MTASAPISSALRLRASATSATMIRPAPIGPQALHGDGADGAGAEHERALPRLDPGLPHRAQADRDRLDERALLVREPVGQPVDHVGRHHSELRHAAATARQPVEAELLAQVRRAPPARGALAAAVHGLDRDAVSERDGLDVVADAHAPRAANSWPSVTGSVSTVSGCGLPAGG